LLRRLVPVRPHMRPEEVAELEAYGVDGVRALLWSLSDGVSGTGSKTKVTLSKVSITRETMQNWLSWKASKDAMWLKVGTVAAVGAALFSLIALFR
jgi:hypothetical protein